MNNTTLNETTTPIPLRVPPMWETLLAWFTLSVSTAGIIVNATMILLLIMLRKKLNLSIGGLIMLSSFCELLMNLEIISSIIVQVVPKGGVVEIFVRCYCHHLPQFVTVPAGKSTLLLISMDRLYAVSKPMVYRVRNHNRFAVGVFCIISLQAIGWLYYALTFETAEDTDVYIGCWRLQNVFTPLIIVTFYCLLIDITTYALNIALLCMTRAPKPAGSTTSAKSEFEHQKERQTAVTKTVMRAVTLHFTLTTIPFIGTLIWFMTDESPSAQANAVVGSVAAIAMSAETMINIYMYVTRLPDFLPNAKMIIKKSM